MDKSTLSQYGWVTVVIIVIVILIGFAAPMGNFVKDSSVTMLSSLTSNIAGENGGVVNSEMIFDISFTPAKKPDNFGNNEITNYSLEEIENNPLLYAVGATKPEYVVAAFNEDYSSVVVTKNGENSDGRMIDYGVKQPDGTITLSPMQNALDTLNYITISDGMDNIVKSLSETYNTSYYASLLLALAVEDEAVFAEALPLAQQGDDVIEEYFNTNMGMNIDDYFKENIGATAHQIAYYIENGVWPN